MSDYNVFVIGTGPAGSAVASACSRAGLKIAIADRRPFGGTCSQRGCNPKKLIVGAAEIADKSMKMKDKGISLPAELNWKELIEYKNSIIKDIPESSEKSYKDSGMDTFHGVCSFEDENKIKVEGVGTFSADNIVVAAGAKPLNLDIPGWDYLTTSDEFMNLKELPEKIIFVGGGYISFEFAHAVRRAGCESVILNDTDRPLAKFEEYTVDDLMKATRDIGIDVRLGSPVVGIEKRGGSYKVKTENGEEYSASLIVHGAGRVSALDSLELDKGNVDRDKKGIIINDNLQSKSNPRVYVAGDANARGIPLTPIASMEGNIVGHNITQDHSIQPDYTVVPSVVFTLPPMASVGITEKEAKENDFDYRVSSGRPRDWYYTKLRGYKNMAYKIILDKDSGAILGAHILGYGAEEVINIFAVAMRMKMTDEDLLNMTYAFPTFGYNIGYMI